MLERQFDAMDLLLALHCSKLERKLNKTDQVTKPAQEVSSGPIVHLVVM